MATCPKCNGWMDDGLSICPSCKRNQDLIDEQESIASDQQNQAEEHEAEMRRIAEEQTAEQERIANETHLNEIKRKLLEIAVEGVSEPKTAGRKALVIMQSPDFADNVDWFWSSVSKNKFLKNTYLTDLFSEVDQETDSTGFFDPMDASVYNDAWQWVQANQSHLPNGDVVISKFNEYAAVLSQREKNQKEQEAEEQKKAAAEQSAAHFRELKQKASLGTLGLISSIIFVAAALPVAWHIISLWFAAWSHGGNPSDWAVRLASAGSSPLGSGVAVWTGIILYLLGLFVGVKAAWGGVDESDDDNKTIHMFLAFVGTVILTVHFWNQVTDSRYHVAMVAACVILPLVPFVRLCLASLGGGMALAYILVVPAWVVGWTTGSLTGWFTKEHPVQQTPAAHAAPAQSVQRDTTSEIINRIQSGQR